MVGFRLLNERYTSRVALEPGRSVIAEARDTQLFHQLRNEWRFARAPGGGTELHFAVDFTFRSQLYAQTAALFFDEVVLRMVSAFEARCAELWDADAQRAHAAAEAAAAAAAAAAAMDGAAAAPAAPVPPLATADAAAAASANGRRAPPLPPLQRSLW